MILINITWEVFPSQRQTTKVDWLRKWRSFSDTLQLTSHFHHVDIVTASGTSKETILNAYAYFFSFIEYYFSPTASNLRSATSSNLVKEDFAFREFFNILKETLHWVLCHVGQREVFFKSVEMSPTSNQGN